MQNATIAKHIGLIHLLYLSLLPAIGTGYLIWAYQPGEEIFLPGLLLGTAAVGIYIAATASYTKITDSIIRNLMMLVDGPIFAALTIIRGGSLMDAIVRDILIEIIAVLLGTLVLTCVSKLPTREQRIGSFFALGLPLIATAVLFFFIDRAAFIPASLTTLFILGGISQSSITQYRNASMDEVRRSAEGFIIIGILAWLSAFLVGGAALAISEVVGR